MNTLNLRGVLFYLSVLVAGLALVRDVWARRKSGQYPIQVLLRDRFALRPGRLRAAAYAVAAGLAVTLVPTAIGVWSGPIRLTLVPFAASTAGLALANLALIFVWAATEELIFRGAVLPQLQVHTSRGVALGGSAFLFLAMHLGTGPTHEVDLLRASVWFMDGLCYGIAYLLTESLWAPALWHAAHNLGVWAGGVFVVQLTPGIWRADYGGSERFITYLHALVTAVITVVAIVRLVVAKKKEPTAAGA